MDPEQYHRTLARINRYYQDGETSTYMQLLESVAGCVSLYALYCCYDGSLVRQMRQMDDFIESENKLIYVPRGVLIVNPLSNGNRYVCEDARAHPLSPPPPSPSPLLMCVVGSFN